MNATVTLAKIGASLLDPPPAPAPAFRLPEGSDPDGSAPAAVEAAGSLVAQNAVGNTRSVRIQPGEAWPLGSFGDIYRPKEQTVSDLFREATPPSLEDLAPAGMRLPVAAGFNTRPATDEGRLAAKILAGGTALGLGQNLAANLLAAYVSGRGVPQVLDQGQANDLMRKLAAPGSEFMRDQAAQIEERIRAQIDSSGQTSGTLRGATDWMTTNARGYENSLGLFSGKLLYDLSYSQRPDGTIQARGTSALAVQDLYNFKEAGLHTSIPSAVLPPAFTRRPGYTTGDGAITDRALAGLQQEGIAAPFYTLGVSDLRSLEMKLGPGRDAWKVH